MIHDALLILAEKLDAHVKLRTGQQGGSKAVVLTNVSDGSNLAIPDNSVGLSLVNVEEEKTNKAQRAKYINQAGRVEFRNPEININLYVLVSANYLRLKGDTTTTKENYYEGLKRLSYVMEYFQARNVFTPENTPEMALTFVDPNPDDGGDDPTLNMPGRKLEKLIVDLYSYSFEQMYNFWSVLGVSYLPSVLYKVRLVTILNEELFGSGDPITQIHMQSQSQ